MSLHPHSSTPLAASDSGTWRRDAPVVIASDVRMSIIIPVLSEEKLLARTLATYTDALRREFKMEVIVSDGGSTDATLEIACAHADVVQRHVAQHRQTIAEGRNCGALLARGEVLVFINGDTMPAEPRIFFEHVRAWSEHHGKYERYGALACPVEVNPSERKWSDVLFHTFFNNYLKLVSFLNIGMGRGECQIVRRDVFDAAGGYNAELAAGEDFELFSRIARNVPVAIANELLVYESPRRYRRFGYIRILWSWFMNWVGAMFFSRSVSKVWEVVR